MPVSEIVIWIIARSVALNRKRELAVLGKLAGIAENIEKALLHLGAVSAHAANFSCHTKLERVAVFGHQGRYDRSHFVEKRRNVDLLNENFHLAGFNLREVEDVIDQAQQMTAGTFDFLEVGDKLLLAAVGRVFLKDLAVTNDRIERGAQFVTHIGQELALGPIGDFR